ncbi:MAG TPA: hypothetical protein DCL99_02520 [Firmicutes bacterium]|jgi:sugar phosphate isomerase/epimerase|nr:hypothetical protein [Bacillota bacterium]
MTHTPIIGIVQDKYAFPDALHFLELGKRLGAQHLELKFELNLDAQYNLRGPTALEIRKKAEQHRISLSVHAPYDDGVNLGAADSETWAETRRQMMACLHFADKIGAQYITVHGGHFEIEPQTIVAETLGQPNRVTVRQRADQAEFAALKARTLEELSWLVGEGSRLGIKVALENFHDFSTFKVRFPLNPEDFQECLAAVSGLYVNYDSGHGHSTGLHILDFIHGIGVKHIIGTHLHDNKRLGDEHLPLLQGTIDFASFFTSYLQENWAFPLNVEAKNLADLEASWAVLKKLRNSVEKGWADAGNS